MERGRPKAQIPRRKRLDLRLTDFEFEKIFKISKKLGITKTETIIRAIELLENYKPKKYKSFAKNKMNNEPGVIRGDSDDD